MYSFAPAASYDELMLRVAERIGLSVPESRRPSMARAVRRTMERHRLKSTTGLLARLENDQALTGELVAEMTVGETYFFRDPQQLEAVRDQVVPALLRACSPHAPIRIWSAGCSTGEEAYSLAIMMYEMGLADRTRIIATDISAAAIHKAGEARYGSRSCRGGAAARVKPHALRTGRHLRLNDRLRGSVRFDRFALGMEELPTADGTLADLDLILCRNVLIYFRPEVVRRVALQFYDALGEGGWLLLAPSDPPLWDHAPFVTCTTPAGIIYRKEERTRGDSENCVPEVGMRKDAATDKEPVSDAVGASSDIGDRLRQASLTQGDERWVHDIESLLRADDEPAAAALASEAVRRYPVSTKLHYLYGTILMGRGRLDDAQAVLRRLAYLDGTSPAPHFLLGICLQPSNRPAALQALETALSLCANCPSEQAVELMKGHSAEQLAMRIRREIVSLQSARNADL